MQSPHSAPPVPRLRALVLAAAGVLTGGLAAWAQDHADLAAPVLSAMLALHPAQWVLAALSTAISFLAVSRYDRACHRIAGTGLPDVRAGRSGAIAIAIGQATGLSAWVGGAVRLHLMRDLGWKPVAHVSALVALSFTAAWSIVALAAIGLVSARTGFAFPSLSLTALAACVAGVALIRLHRRGWMQMTALVPLLGWTALDLGAAALALWWLLPTPPDVALPVFIAIVVLALGAGIASNLPAGIGAFDLVFLALLPGPTTASILAALVAFRLVYHVLPATLALAALRQRPQALPGPVFALWGQALYDCWQTAAPPSWGLAAQVGRIMRLGTARAHVAHLPLVDVMLGDPIGPRAKASATFAAWARNRGRAAVIYKAGAATAATARAQGWHVARIAEGAWIDPRSWTTQGSARQSLRRKLRRAASGGVRATLATGPLPVARMTAIAADWRSAHGGEMGFSMGVFCPALIAQQRVVLIHQDARLCGFVTFHANPRGWALDLMRHDANLPDGAMQAAIVAAIAAARAEGVPHLCMAAVPADTGPMAHFGAGRQGLAQFKRGFAPQWQPLYICAPSRLALWLAVPLIWQAVRWPRPPRQVRLTVPAAIPAHLQRAA